jgi:hypothetical protein
MSLQREHILDSGAFAACWAALILSFAAFHQSSTPYTPPEEFWIKNLHITVQFAAVNGMWIAVSVDAIAAVRFLGIYTLAGHNLAPPVAVASTPSR